ncbi:MAG: protein phosphatase 2C domain-containing protein [Myxococcales bacterium]|nr:protein phosphatase 2C domain-containing protein [Myxococcales bacterium]
MNPIRDIGEINPGAVLYHSAFGFARVRDVESDGVQLEWESKGDNLPVRVGHDVVLRVYARCSDEGFFHRATHEPEELQQLLQENPGQGLALLLSDLHGPQREQDLKEWIVGRELMTAPAFAHWWQALQSGLSEDLRFHTDSDGIALRTDDVGEGPRARLENPMLAPGRRLDLALAHRSELDDEAFFLEQVVLAWRTGGTQVKDLAMAALRNTSADDVLRGLLAAGKDSIDGIIHGIRRAGWSAEDVSADVHEALVDLAMADVPESGPLDDEGRLLAALARWPSPGILEILAEHAGLTDGRRLLRSTFAALPPKRAEELSLDLLEICLDSPDPKTAQWLGGEALAIALVEPTKMADRIEGEHPAAAHWFRNGFQEVEAKDPMAEYDERVEDTPHTAEIDLSDVVAQPLPLANLPARAGSSLLGLGLGIARALAVHHKEGRVVNPTAVTVKVLPNETMEVEPSERDDDSCPRPPAEEPSPASDVYAASVLLLEALLGRRWPRTLPASRAIPYLRTAVPLLPPSALAPLDAGLHPDPAKRPRDGLEWLARWQTAAVTEESRTYAARNPSVRLRIGYDSHVGRMKVLLTQTNQDALFLATKGPLSLLVVCDGISTANAGSGDVAASIACHVIANLWEQALPRLTNAGPRDLSDFLDRALRMANTAVCEAALRFAGGNLDGRVPMGTTCTVAVVHGNWVSLAWLGDSRSYLVGPYGASLLTADENQAGERLRAWHLNYIDSWDPAGFALVGYLGHFNDMMRPEALSAHHTSFTLLAGESLAICSDGVTDYVGDTHPEVASILAAVGSVDDPDEAARQLVGLANRGGGGDNATCLIARLWE